MDRDSMEQNLMSYLYGEMDEDARKQFEKELKNSPALQQELEELQDMRSILSSWQDEETQEPSIIIKNDRFAWRTWMSWAAAVTLLISVGFLSGLEVKWNQSSLMIGYGLQEVVETDSPGFTAEDVKRMMEDTKRSLQYEMDEKMSGLELKFSEGVSDLREENGKQLASVIQKLNANNNEIITRYVSQMNEDQRELIESLFTASQEQQELYTKNILTDFGAFLEEQRISDLENITTYINAVKITAEEQDVQTQQILESIISQVNAQPIAD